MTQAEVDYGGLEPGNVVDYVATQPELARLFDPASIEEITEVGDGNLNLVFIVRCQGTRGLVLKQALPYLRLVGPSWPLTPDRARHEAETMMTYADWHRPWSPRNLPLRPATTHHRDGGPL